MLFDRDALNRLFRYAYTLTGDEPSAYDLLQDTVERCLRRRTGSMDRPEAYAKRVMRNLYIDLQRRSARSPVSSGLEAIAEPVDMLAKGLEHMAIAQDQLECIWGMLDAFEREILYLWALEGMNAEQIASELDSRRGTIVSRIHRLRNRLRSTLEDQPEVQEVG